MKQLQLWLLAALFCCGVMGQSPVEIKNTVSLSTENTAFSFFTVTPQNGRTLLRWAAPVRSEDFFVIEKSRDAEHFEVLSAMDATQGIDSVYSLVDNSVGNGTTFYRIRITGKTGRELCSKTVNTQALTQAEFRFYPNPVDKLLIVRSNHALSIQVMDAYGVIWFNQDIEPGMQIVNVSALQKGNYILKGTDKTTNTSFSEQLVKNN